MSGPEYAGILAGRPVENDVLLASARRFLDAEPARAWVQEFAEPARWELDVARRGETTWAHLTWVPAGDPRGWRAPEADLSAFWLGHVPDFAADLARAIGTSVYFYYYCNGSDFYAFYECYDASGQKLAGEGRALDGEEFGRLSDERLERDDDGTNHVEAVLHRPLEAKVGLPEGTLDDGPTDTEPCVPYGLETAARETLVVRG